VGQKKFGKENPDLIRAMASMGGGIATTGGPCGAILGGVAFLGYLMGKDEPEKKDDPFMWKTCLKFYKRFQDEVAGEYDGINCRDIAGVDWSDLEQTKAFFQGEGGAQCIRNTGKAARILGEVIEKYLDKND
jgi:C_GCAxxG_C_C family probable redox protein